MKEEEIQKRAIEFQEMYYPSNTAPLNQNDQAEALRFAYAQGWEMGVKSYIKEAQEDEIDFL